MGGGTEGIISLRGKRVRARQAARDQELYQDIRQSPKHYRLGLHSIFSVKSKLTLSHLVTCVCIYILQFLTQVEETDRGHGVCGVWLGTRVPL